MPPAPFGILKYGEPIDASPLAQRVETGISYEDIRQEFGFISEYEERDVALKSGYRWEDWLDISIQDRVYHVAFHRLHLLINAHSQDAVARQRNKSRHG